MFRKKTRVLLACLLVLPLLVGCVQSKVVIRVNKDGSGTVTERTMMKLGGLGALLAAQGGDGADPAAKQKEKAEKTAAEMGEGVSVESVKALPAKGEWTGFETIYKFEDISKIAVSGSMEPGGDGPSPGLGDDPNAADAPKKAKPKLTFEFTSGDTAHLVIHLPNTLGGDDMPQGAPAPQEMAMLRSMLAEAKMEVSLEVEGTITETDADYVSPSKKSIGLTKMKLGDLLADDKAMAAFSTLDRSDKEAAIKAIRSKPISKYVQVEAKDVVEISFE